MKTTLLLSSMLVLSSNAFADEMADACAACHRDALSLQRWNADDLHARLRQMTADSAGHPVPLPALSDEGLRVLAEALAGSP